MSSDDGRGLPDFRRSFHDAKSRFTQIGDGELGGKAAGLDRILSGILPRLAANDYPRFRIDVPALTVLKTGVFDRFMKRNALYDIALTNETDERIALAFQSASLPAEFVGDLRALITEVHSPLAVRSSSLLEDALQHPFAGVYETKMIPANQWDPDTRFRKLIEAIKFVYASTFFRAAKNYIRSVKQDQRSEKMAVIVQEVVGNRHGDHYYPWVSGVARSYNYYATGNSEPEDGVVDLALGLGKQIVDGGIAWTYCPAYPKAPLPFNDIKDLLDTTQRNFWAVNMGSPPPPDPIHETEYLVQADLEVAELDETLHGIASTYDASSDRLRMGTGISGPRVLNFAPILQGESPPLNDLVRDLLKATKEEMNVDVEIEFAVSLPEKSGGQVRFGYLQARPMLVPGDEVVLTAEDLDGSDLLLASDQALGNGERSDIVDVVFLKRDVFDTRHSLAIAGEVEQINRDLVESDTKCLLIGFGRWGSSDHWLGVPVNWGQISAARVIVESTLPDLMTEMSQGSHFFHNVISFGVLYLSLRHAGPHQIDWEWLEAHETVAETPFVRHVRLKSPLTARVDGRSGRGVIRIGR